MARTPLVPMVGGEPTTDPDVVGPVNGLYSPKRSASNAGPRSCPSPTKTAAVEAANETATRGNVPLPGPRQRNEEFAIGKIHVNSRLVPFEHVQASTHRTSGSSGWVTCRTWFWMRRRTPSSFSGSGGLAPSPAVITAGSQGISGIRNVTITRTAKGKHQAAVTSIPSRVVEVAASRTRGTCAGSAEG